MISLTPCQPKITSPASLNCVGGSRPRTPSNKGCEPAARETPGPVRFRAAARVRPGRIPQRCGGQPVTRVARDDDVPGYPLHSSRGPSAWNISAVDAQRWSRGGTGTCDARPHQHGDHGPTDKRVVAHAVSQSGIRLLQ